MKTNRIITGEALAELKKLPDESIDCVMTSPPYWGLRDYGVEGQLGLEPDFRDFIKNLCDIFDEVKRVLKKTGTCWVNLGDTYGGTKQGNTESNKNPNTVTDSFKKSGGQEKSLVQIPSRFAIEMTDRGWILRNEIIWYKKNVMPSSVKDRFTVDFEKIFFFTKNRRYYFEQQFEPTNPDVGWLKSSVRKRGKNERINRTPNDKREPIEGHVVAGFNEEGRNKRTVWQINPKPFSEAHFAVFPPKLVETPVKSGCPEFVCKKCGKARERLLDTKTLERYELPKGDPRYRPDRYDKKYPGKGMRYAEVIDKGLTDCGCNAGFESGVVLDPFFGSGTTALVAEKLNRKWLGIELNPEYVKIAEKRLGQQGLGI